MEELIDTKHGIGTLLATIALVICMQLVLKVGEFLWEIFKKKSEVTEDGIEKLTGSINQNTRAVEELKFQLTQIEKEVIGLPKMKEDLNRNFTAIKILAGERWPEIRAIILPDRG